MDTTKPGPPLINIIKLCYQADQPILLVGGHGIGKSHSTPSRPPTRWESATAVLT